MMPQIKQRLFQLQFFYYADDIKSIEIYNSSYCSADEDYLLSVAIEIWEKIKDDDDHLIEARTRIIGVI